MNQDGAVRRSACLPPVGVDFFDQFKSKSPCLSAWHANVISSLRRIPGAPVVYCDAGLVTKKHDPWIGLYKRPVGVAAIKTLTSPYNLGFTVARNMALACLGLAHKHIMMLTEAEEKAIETNTEPEYVPFPWDDLPEVLKRGGFNSCMDVTVLSLRGILDWLAGEVLLPDRCSVETVVRMHTDMRRTSRALAPAYPVIQRVSRVFRTALWSEITLYMSEWLVTSVLDTVRFVMEGKDRLVERVLLKMTVNSARCATLWLAVSIGNGVGASSPKAKPLFMLAGANAAALLVNLFFRILWRRVEVQMFGGICGNDDDSGEDNAGVYTRQQIADGCEGTDGDDDHNAKDCDVVDDDVVRPTPPRSGSTGPSGIPRLPPRRKSSPDSSS